MFKMLVEDLVVVVTSRTPTCTKSIESAATTLAASDNTPPAISNVPPAASGNATTGEGSVLDDDSATHVAPTQASILGSWYFTGYYVFALLGPIVPSNMKPYCAELLMASCKPLVGKGPGGKKTIDGAGRAAARRKSSSTTATPPGIVKVEQPHGSAMVA
jgi:hypothetical protein